MSLDRYIKKLLVMCDFGDTLKSLGTDPRIKVGALVFPVDCSAVFGIGYNGAAAGLDHDSVLPRGGELGTGVSGAAHAEANALLKAGDRARSSLCLLYCSLMPCPYCAPLIANTFGVCGVIVGESRADTKSGLHVLEAARIPVLYRDQIEFARLKVPEVGERPTAVVEWWRSMRVSRLESPRMLWPETSKGTER